MVKEKGMKGIIQYSHRGAGARRSQVTNPVKTVRIEGT